MGRSGMRRGAVVEADDAVGEGFGGEEFEADGAVARLDQGMPWPMRMGNEGGNDKDFVPHLRCSRLSRLSFFTQPLRAGLTYGAPTALLGSENSNPAEPRQIRQNRGKSGRTAANPAEPRQIRQNRGKSGRTAAESAVLDAHAALWSV